MRKAFSIFLMTVSIGFSAFAQRAYDRGRISPQDYMDYPDYSSSSDNPIFYIILLGVLVVGVIYCKIDLKVKRRKEIEEKTLYLTNIEFTAFTSATAVIQCHNCYYKLSDYYVEDNGKVLIPKYARCIILEYVQDNHSFVKVRFDDYPSPLYIPRWYLRTPDRINQ